MKTLKLIIPLIILVINSCNNESPKKELINKIKAKEKALQEAVSQQSSSKQATRALLKLYDQYHMNFPKDAKGADYLMKGGEVALHNNQYKRAIGFFDAVEINFENSKHYPMAVFMKGFVFDQLQDTARARAYYKKFIKENPDHELIEDAKISIENLGKSLEEIIREFEEEKSQRKNQKEKPKQIDEGF